MPPAGYFVDTSLLMLLVAGTTDRGLIGRHRRLQGYTVEDYDLLLDIAGRPGRVFVTPNTLTEASNLLAQHGEPDRSLLPGGLRSLIEESEEVVVRSAEASSNAEYVRLGLTDAALRKQSPPTRRCSPWTSTSTAPRGGKNPTRP